MSKQLIEVSLDPFLQDFLYHEFKTDLKTGAIIITRDSTIGKYMASMIECCDRPYKREVEYKCKILLPISANTHYRFRNSYIYIPAWKEEMIHDFLKAEWTKRVTDIFAIGRDRGFKQKHIIEAIIKEYGMKNNSITYDRIKKMDYRSRESFIKKVVREIQCAVI